MKIHLLLVLAFGPINVVGDNLYQRQRGRGGSSYNIINLREKKGKSPYNGKGGYEHK